MAGVCTSPHTQSREAMGSAGTSEGNQAREQGGASADPQPFALKS